MATGCGGGGGVHRNALAAFNAAIASIDSIIGRRVSGIKEKTIHGEMLHMQHFDIDRWPNKPNNGQGDQRVAESNQGVQEHKGAEPMFDQIFENLQKATESTMKMQQEMLQKWVEVFPTGGGTSMPSQPEAVAEFRKKWEEAAIEMLKRQKELVDQSYDAGVQSLENVFSVADAKNAQEYQEKMTELYRKSLESLRDLTEAQMNEFKAAAEKCSQLMTSQES
jgi:hypothetical protein